MIDQALYQIISLDLPAVLCALFACMACALLGNFLVLRKISLMGDAISHAVLPGIVISFLLSGSRGGVAVFIGAAIAGIVTTVLVELVRSFGRLDSGAAMGVVFSIMFAMGVLLIEQAAARNVDLDADCLLHGQLETIFWYPPNEWAQLFSLAAFRLLPSEVLASAAVLIASIAFVVLFYKELTLAAFDSALATSLGINAKFLHYALMVVVAGAVVASFEAVGSILVIAMIICPAATARFYTDKLKVQIALSQVFACLAVICGYILGGFGPLWLGYDNAINAGGMMTVVAGLLLFTSALVAPEYGIISRQLRRLALSTKVYREDFLAALFRAEEKNLGGLQKESMFENLGKNLVSRAAFRKLLSEKLIEIKDNMIRLSEKGKTEAQALVRSHRLWESFLVDKAGIQADHVHSSAEKLEHFTQSELGQKLAEEQSYSQSDPHGKKIP